VNSSHPLPPVSRIEERSDIRRCVKLREKLADALSSVIRQCVTTHHLFHDLVDSTDVRQYHEIYDISLQEYSAAVSISTQRPDELRGSLSELRLSYKTLILASKVLLCDLLALPPARSGRDRQQWIVVSSRMHNLAVILKSSAQEVGGTLVEEESREWGAGTTGPERGAPEDGRRLSNVPLTPGRQQANAQFRRLEAISNGIRALHAKTHVLREEIDSLVDVNEDSSNLTAALAKQYDTIGTELRGLLSEWEQGRSTMFLAAERCDRYSRSSSGLRSPSSPSPSLGGLTAVDEGPAEALRVLSGEDVGRKMVDFGASDEEVFEAVSIPRKRGLMTREEKMAKMQEDRRKRATLQDRTDASTHMLRELETVIKHRPRGRTTSRISTL